MEMNYVECIKELILVVFVSKDIILMMKEDAVFVEVDKGVLIVILWMFLNV